MQLILRNRGYENVHYDVGLCNIKIPTICISYLASTAFIPYHCTNDHGCTNRVNLEMEPKYLTKSDV